ncbi:PEPxxWA-CTERM sorting domain-containing protein [Phenylobacterium sp.]|uniref:PEPxxWA-CTERM sorting domain-containing protein n=1 Tax=Phenylobacterium sp. TaxID=1871053 RepID=UPI0012249E76|nr:PEPxxWA-CTERM sorting domain-containing protein [Phenylobacterium sp.]THD61329.1 MAG: PEP-CTERM sorting domain-containing protein [Phenylobacterium sp.]
MKKIFAVAAIAAGLSAAGAASAGTIFSEDFSGYSLPSTNGAMSSGVSSTSGDSFTTAYSYRTGTSNTGPNSMYDEGTWTIGTNPFAVHSLWVNLPSSNPFLMLNGATTDTVPPPAAYISNAISVAPGEYSYSYQLLNLCCNSDGPPGTPSVLQLWYYAPGASTPTNIDFTINTTPAANGWQTVSGTFDIAEPGGTIHLGLSDDSSIASGNDFGVDNIRLASVPEPAAWSLMILGFGGLGAVLRRRRGQVAIATA